MKLIAEYLASAIKFEQFAATEQDPQAKLALELQAAAYRKLAEKRAAELGVPLPDKPTSGAK